MPDTENTPSPAPETAEAPTPAGPAPVFIVIAYPAENVFGSLDDATAKLKELAAANPGVEYAVFESRRTGEAPAPAVETTDIKPV